MHGGCCLLLLEKIEAYADQQKVSVTTRRADIRDAHKACNTIDDTDAVKHNLREDEYSGIIIITMQKENVKVAACIRG